MSTFIGLLLVLAWVSSAPLLARAVCALNDSPRGVAGLAAHGRKFLLIFEAGGYFCIFVIAPFDLNWALWGGTMVLISRGATSAYAYLAGYAAETAHRIDDAFNVEL